MMQLMLARENNKKEFGFEVGLSQNKICDKHFEVCTFILYF